MDARMYLVNKRTGHVIRLASFSYGTGWDAGSDPGLSDKINAGFQVAQDYAHAWGDEDWEIGYEGHPDVRRYLNYRHPIGIRN